MTRWKKIVREYGLIPMGRIKSFWQRSISMALDASETRKYAVYRSIKERLPGCRTLEELEQRLLQYGDRYPVHESDQQVWRKDRDQFPLSERGIYEGKDIDRDCSLQQLQNKLQQRQQLTQWESEKLALKAAQGERMALEKKEELKKVQQRRLKPENAVIQEEHMEQEVKRMQEQRIRPAHRLRIH